MSIAEREITLPNAVVPEEPRRRLFTRAEYYQLAEEGIIGSDERLELINGEIWKMSPQGTAHATAIRRVENYLRKAFDEVMEIRTQSPLTLSDLSEPEPDVTLARGTWEDYVAHHPHAADVLLLVEISDATLRLDRKQKALDYARSEIAEYWIVNLPERVVETHRSPVDGIYASVTTIPETEEIAPLAAPSTRIKVRDLLPPVNQSPRLQPQP